MNIYVDIKEEKYFYPRPPRGGRPNSCMSCAGTSYFYPRPPRGGRHGVQRKPFAVTLFLSTPSARRATLLLYSSNSLVRFLSTPSARRATGCLFHLIGGSRYFYPRPPRGGRPINESNFTKSFEISIHALREEGDPQAQTTKHSDIKFLSTPSARRATFRPLP